MLLTNYPHLRGAVLFCLAGLVITFSSCDSPSSSVEKSQPDMNAIHKSADFFAHSPDSVNSMLTAAMDTLRKDDSIYPFISKFIEKRGLPIWNKASGFYREGTPVFKVPVRHALKRKITGYVTIVINNRQPTYDWTARGAKVNGEVSETIETIIWGYEKRVFGKTHTDGGVRIETKPAPISKLGNVMSEKQEDPSCHRFCSDEGCSEWICEDDENEGDNGEPDGGAGDGGDHSPPHGGDGDADEGGGGNGGNSDGDNESTDPEEECKNNAANVPFPGLKDPNKEEDPYEGPSYDPGCEKEEISFLGKIVTTDLTDHPNVNGIYQKLNQTQTMQNVISKFAGEDTEFNLNISVGDAGDAYGALDSSLGDDTFQMIISDSELDRTPLEISGTFLHETIHAEMRRYLYGATDTSTLSGFPGDFSSDWDNYVLQKYGDLQDPVTAAEHEAMAKKYTRIIADGLEEFDKEQLKRSHYEALAYVSLIDTETWKNLEQEKKDEIGANYQDLKDDVLDKRSNTCN